MIEKWMRVLSRFVANGHTLIKEKDEVEVKTLEKILGL